VKDFYIYLNIEQFFTSNNNLVNKAANL